MSSQYLSWLYQDIFPVALFIKVRPSRGQLDRLVSAMTNHDWLLVEF